MLKRISAAKLALGAACLALSPLALATTIPSADLTADCDGYTLTFHGTGFIAVGESLNVQWQIVLQDEVSGARTVAAGQATLTETAPLDGIVDLTVDEVWPTQLCGRRRLLLPIEDNGEGSSYRYGNDAFGGRELISFKAPVNRLLDCNCDDVLEVCRSAGFWGTHSGTDRWGGKNITQSVVDAADGLEICGKAVDVTSLSTTASALEALCVSPRGDQRLQLARQLTAAALNCVVSGGGPLCEGVSIEELFGRCNSLCASGNSGEAIGSCIDALDCFSNGGKQLSNGICQIGSCANDPTAPCASSCDCGLDNYGKAVACNPLADSCAKRPLINDELGLNFEPAGPASSAMECGAAHKNSCTLFACSGGTSCSGQSHHHHRGPGRPGQHGHHHGSHH